MTVKDKLKVMLAHLSHAELNALEPIYEPEVISEADHFYTCEHCGQAVDRRRLGDVFYHDEPGHDPLPMN